MANKKALPAEKSRVVPEGEKAQNQSYPVSDNSPTDNRIEPINVQPGDQQEAVESQEATNDARLEADRQEYFRDLTQTNPTAKFLKTVNSLGGLPGNQSPAMNEVARGRTPDFAETPEGKAMEEARKAKETPDEETEEQRKDQVPTARESEGQG